MYSWIKWHKYLKKNLKQYTGCPLKKDLMNLWVLLFSNILIPNDSIIWMKIWQKQPESSLSLRKINHKLVLSFCKSNAGQNVLFFIGPALRNKIPEKMKKNN